MSASQPPGFPDLPGINAQEGLKRLMNKTALYEKVLRDFHSRFLEEIPAIRANIAAGDTQTATRQAHSLKGLAGTIGASQLQQLASELQQNLSQQIASEALLEQLESELKLVLNSIAQAFVLAPTPPEKPEA